MYRKTLILFVFLTMAYSIVTAQERPDPKNPENANLEVPANWNVRPDHHNDELTIGSDSEKADIFFVNMTPGWHITTGPAAIFWHPGSTAEGTYRAETVIHLFNPHGRTEAFGLFIGGKNLEKDTQTYSYFLLRNTGEYLIKKRIGDETETVKNWSEVSSMITYTDSTKSSVENHLAVEVGEDEVSFFVNDVEVATVPKSRLDTEGVVGLRINHRLNVHVEDLAVKEL